MPIYEYQCEECERQTEAIQRLDDPPMTLCPHCGGPLRKLMSAPAFQFKGTGWYVTDYADKKGSGGAKTRGGGEGGSETSTSDSSKSDSGKSESTAKSESSSSSGS